MVVSPHADALRTAHRYQGDSNDCGPYVVTTIVNALQGLHLEPAQVAEAMNQPAWRGRRPVVRRVPGWASFPWGLVDILGRFGLTARWRARARVAELVPALEQGWVLVPFLGGWRPWPPWGHVAVLVAHSPNDVPDYGPDHSPEDGPRGWGMVDPMTRTNELYWRSEADFSARWRALGNLLVEVAPPRHST